MLQWERLRRFHRNTLWRYIAQDALIQLIEKREAATDLAWVADAIATGLRDLVYHRNYGDREWASDVLSKFAVIPEIDALIHAPQVALASTYFLAVDETTGVDVELSRYGDPQCPLVNFLPKNSLTVLVRSAVHTVFGYLFGERPGFHYNAQRKLRFKLPRGTGVYAGWRSKTYPPVDYSIESVETTDTQSKLLSTKGSPKQKTPLPSRYRPARTNIARIAFGPWPSHFRFGRKVSQVVIDPDARLVEHLHEKVGNQV